MLALMTLVGDPTLNLRKREMQAVDRHAVSETLS
jgi:hypothetical protein